jgi:putative protease
MSQLFTALGDYLLGRKESYFSPTPLAILYHEAQHGLEFVEKLQAEYNALKDLESQKRRLTEELKAAREKEKILLKAQAPNFAKLGEASWSFYRLRSENLSEYRAIFRDLEGLNQAYSQLAEASSMEEKKETNWFGQIAKAAKRWSRDFKRWTLDKKLVREFTELGKAVLATDFLQNLDQEHLAKAGEEILKNQAEISALFQELSDLSQRENSLDLKLEQMLFGEGLERRLNNLLGELQGQKAKNKTLLRRLGKGYFFHEEKILTETKPLKSLIEPLEREEMTKHALLEEKGRIQSGLAIQDLQRSHQDLEEEIADWEEKKLKMEETIARLKKEADTQRKKFRACRIIWRTSSGALIPGRQPRKIALCLCLWGRRCLSGSRGFFSQGPGGTDHGADGAEIRRIKGDKPVYGALNIFFHNHDLDRLKAKEESLSALPLDAFILSDLGPVRYLQETFPHRELHLSTQASCLNIEAAKMYRDLGFTRLVLGREANLADIAAVKNAVPDVELEVFVHGAMCMAYSGRCFISKHLTGRSANKGDCAHSCRWDLRLLQNQSPVRTDDPPLVLEEKKRPGEYYPVEESERYTTIMSSKDLNMIHHLGDLKSAGVDSIKLEGRMKSAYYVSMVTRSYRAALDDLEASDPSHRSFTQELEYVSHREFSTGFYFDNQEIAAPNTEEYNISHVFMATIPPTEIAVKNKESIRCPEDVPPGSMPLDVRNSIYAEDELEVIGPDLPGQPLGEFQLIDQEGEKILRADRDKTCFIRTPFPLKENYILRKINPPYQKRTAER